MGSLLVVVLAAAIFFLNNYAFKSEDGTIKITNKNDNLVIQITAKDLKVKRLDTSLFDKESYSDLQKKNFEYVKDKEFDIGKTKLFGD